MANPIPTLDAHTQLTGVIGFPVRHSLSPAMQNAAFQAQGLNIVYLAFEVAPDHLPHAIEGMRGLGLLGLNATIPHKQALLPIVKQLTDSARRIGAVNTLFWEGERLMGDNTDAHGFMTALQQSGFDPTGARVLVLGAGGSARAVVYALRQANATLFMANRSREKAEAFREEWGLDGVYDMSESSLQALMPTLDLVVQCTSLGMQPNTELIPPVPLGALPAHAWVYDLVYRPEKTRFLQAAEARGLKTLGGLDMLIYQGAAAYERWTGQMAPIEIMRRAVRTALEG